MAALPLPGEYPELDAQTRVPILLGLSIAFLVLAAIIVLLRLITRFIIVKAPGSDDYTIVFALVRLPLAPRATFTCSDMP